MARRTTIDTNTWSCTHPARLATYQHVTMNVGIPKLPSWFLAPREDPEVPELPDLRPTSRITLGPITMDSAYLTIPHLPGVSAAVSIASTINL